MDAGYFKLLYIVDAGNGTAEVTISPGNKPDWSKPVTLLLPGYNSDAKSASESFRKLFKMMQSLETLPEALQPQSTWLVLWPGYAGWGLAHGMTFFSPATYPLQIGSAGRAAGALRSYIDLAAFGPVVNLIAHSLGCRLALELLQKYTVKPSANPPRFHRVVLFAAAVPWVFLRVSQKLRRGAHLPERLITLYSHRDNVLNGAFRLGQTVGGEGFLPRAVGATGWPGEVFYRTVPTRNGHSSYFEDRKTGFEILTQLGTALPIGLPALVADAESVPLASLELPAAGLPEVGLPSRRLLGT